MILYLCIKRANFLDNEAASAKPLMKGSNY